MPLARSIKTRFNATELSCAPVSTCASRAVEKKPGFTFNPSPSATAQPPPTAAQPASTFERPPHAAGKSGFTVRKSPLTAGKSPPTIRKWPSTLRKSRATPAATPPPPCDRCQQRV